MNYIPVNFECNSVYVFCALSGDCGSPRSLTNGQRSYSSTTVGYTVTYTCITGYRMTAGSSSRTCQSNGQWSGIHPRCEQVTGARVLANDQAVESLFYSRCIHCVASALLFLYQTDLYHNYITCRNASWITAFMLQALCTHILIVL